VKLEIRPVSREERGERREERGERREKREERREKAEFVSYIIYMKTVPSPRVQSREFHYPSRKLLQ
jgi:hypothetical protein